MDQMDEDIGIYIHIPFCVKKCDYCDFLSAPAGAQAQRRYMEALREEIRLTAETEAGAARYVSFSRVSSSESHENVVAAGGTEAEAGSARHESFPRVSSSESHENALAAGGTEADSPRRVCTIFFGGGTPSLLPAEEIVRTLAAVRDYFAVAEDAEITVECNPGTLTEEKCRAYRAAGVNRLSIGLQSADNRLLKGIGRIHTFEEFLDSYAAARRAGFTNVNVDLMSGLPGQSVGDHVDTLQRVLELGPEHISAYSLILEEGTPLYERIRGEGNPDPEESGTAGEKKAGTAEIRKGKGLVTEEIRKVEEEAPGTVRIRKVNGEIPEMAGKRELEGDKLPSEDEEMEMYVKTREILEAHGYHRYEISNYSLPGMECRHNLRYWDLLDYQGFGIGAASFMDGCRYKNLEDRRRYMELLQPGEREKNRQKEVLKKLRTEFARETDRELMEEFLFLGLRKVEGIRPAEFAGRFGLRFDTVYGSVKEKLAAQGFLAESADGSRIRLTDRGLDFSNEVLAEFLL